MKARKPVEKDILSYVVAQITAKEKDMQQELEDDAIMQLIKKEIKMRKETMAMLTTAGKPEDLAEEAWKIAILKKYLPDMMSREDLHNQIQKLITELSIQDLSKERGKVISALMQEHKASIDGALMNEVIQEMIG
jgi:uncharacterized protein YqeY